MRCPDCNKFVAYDEPECEVSNVEVDGSSVIAQVAVRLNCADCGTTLKECEIETTAEFDHVCKPEAIANNKDGYEEGDEQFEIENDGDPEGSSRMETKDRNGKAIKSARYMKTFYGFSIETSVRCLKCGEVFPVTLEGEEQASCFEECC